jgi:hypothetical protein
LGDHFKKNEMGWTCSTYEKDRRAAYNILVEKLMETDDFEEQGVDGRTILQCGMGEVWNGLIWMRIGTGGGLL